MPENVILVVEDNDVTREGLRSLLEGAGYQVITAIHGLDALNQMKSVFPNLIVSDIAMPEMDGFKFYSAVRAQPEGITIPFIFLTARNEREDILDSKKMGVEDYLTKPFDHQELITVIRSRLARTQQLMEVQQEQAYKSTLILMANAIELRDQYTRGHVERVMQYSLMIAEQLHCNPVEIWAIQFGAILHDIGKIYLQGNLLSKAGPLEPGEWDEMRNHTNYGVKLLQNMPFLEHAIPVVRYHHERWDGKGYPDGIAGPEIPLMARIVSVADAFDAMTSGRTYQKAISIEEAFSDLILSSGSKYDPTVVNAFQVAWESQESLETVRQEIDDSKPR